LAKPDEGDFAFTHADQPLNVMVRGDEVIILFSDGARVTMSAHQAEVSAARLLDAAAIARGQFPAQRPKAS